MASSALWYLLLFSHTTCLHRSPVAVAFLERLPRYHEWLSGKFAVVQFFSELISQIVHCGWRTQHWFSGAALKTGDLGIGCWKLRAEIRLHCDAALDQILIYQRWFGNCLGFIETRTWKIFSDSHKRSCFS